MQKANGRAHVAEGRPYLPPDDEVHVDHESKVGEEHHAEHGVTQEEGHLVGLGYERVPAFLGYHVLDVEEDRRHLSKQRCVHDSRQRIASYFTRGDPHEGHSVVPDSLVGELASLVEQILDAKQIES